jgi:hypothetical protein
VRVDAEKKKTDRKRDNKGREKVLRRERRSIL